ncbi:MAG: hypothetical protein HY854_21715 [Burkholderiales bacterium]|nr:hypothetical protein [Burkholderiales bacterium]
MAVAASALVGSWYIPSLGSNAVLTFLPDGSFLVATKAGLESGTYTWNEATGAFGATYTSDSNGSGGLSSLAVTHMTVQGDTLSVDGAIDAVLARMPVSANSIVGSWYAEVEDGGTDQIVFSFFADGTFLISDKGTHANDPTGDSGIEWGTYTWNANTGAFTYNVSINTDGQWGISHPNEDDPPITPLVLSGDTLVIGETGLVIHRAPSGSPTTGTAAANTLTGSAAAETLIGLGGNDSLDGGGGIDTALYSGDRGQFTVTATQAGFTVTDGSGVEGTDTLVHVERLAFNDVNVALDLDGNAGSAAKILGAVFGAASLENEVYVGIGLELLDAGMSYTEVMGFALQAALGDSASNAAVVNLLYTNVIGVAPTAQEAAGFVALLDGQVMTQAQLAVIAADTDFNLANIDMVGLAATGIEFT